MINYSCLKLKIKARIWGKIVSITKDYSVYPLIYYSYWHCKIFTYNYITTEDVNYFTAIPNRGAGIGHQLANWIAGYWHARQLGLQFAHTPFSTERWEQFLGFGEGEVSVEELVKKRGYKKVLLPKFDEFKPGEVALIKRIVDSYRNQKVVFVAEHDQFYKDQHGVINYLKKKFFGAEARKEDHLVYNNKYFNIAIHVRRGDIVVGKETKNKNLLMRWQDNNYFETVLSNVIQSLNTDVPIAIYLFSQGEPKDFNEFEKFKNLHYCLDMGAQDSFLHMVYADLLITSKSSFSYKPALLNNGIKVCPRNFWHGYPKTDDWILAEEDGSFDVNNLSIN